MATPFTDDFSSYSGGAVTSPWESDIASTTTAGNALAFTASGAGIAYDTSTTNHSMQLDWTPGAASISQIQIRKFTNAVVDNFFSLQVDSGNDEIKFIYNDLVAPALTLRTISFTFDAGTTYQLKLEAQGKYIKGFVDGLLLLTEKSTALSISPFVAIRSISGSDRLDTFSNVSITATTPNYYEPWDEVTPEFIKHSGNPIATGGITTTLNKFLWWKVIKITDYGIPEIISGQPYCAYFSDDHGSSSTPGGIYLATAASPLGPWTEYSPTVIFADDTFNQTETPDVIWDDANNRLVLTYHCAGAPSGSRQSTFWAISTDGLNWAKQGYGPQTTTDNDSMLDYGHTGYLRFIGKYRDWWYFRSTWGSRLQGRQSHPEAGRDAVGKTNFSDWVYLDEFDMSWIDPQRFQNTTTPFLWNGYPYFGTTETQQVGSSQFDTTGRLVVGRYTDRLDGAKENWVQPFTIGSGSADGQPWEDSIANLRWCGFYFEGNTLYGYYSIKQNPTTMGVALATIQNSELVAPMRLQESIENKSARRLARGI